MKDANLLERFDDFKVSQYDREASEISIFCYRGIAQSGSAPALGAGCREFESLHPDQFNPTNPLKKLYLLMFFG